MIPRALIDDIGGFDEAFNPVEYEDIDLSYRLRSHGYRIVYEPSVEMYHFESTTTANTAALPNTALIIRHGLLFKRRWKHMFEQEDGPSDPETAWRPIEIPRWDSIGNLPVAE